MPFIGNKPSAVPLTSADIADSIITSAKIVDGTIVNADINASSAIAISKIASTGTSLQVLRMNSGATALEFATPSAGAMVFLASGTASNVATLDLNGYFTSDYDVYKLFIYEAYGSTEAYFRFRVSTTGSYTVQTSSYTNIMGFPYIDSGNTLTAAPWIKNLSGGEIDLGYINNTANYYSNYEVTFHNPRSTTAHKQVSVYGISGYSAYPVIGAMGYGRWQSTTAITGLQFYMSSGNLYGTFRLYGIKNS